VAWTTPLTAVANAALTAAQWNASVRDNLAETAAARATTAGSIFVGTGANSLAERIPASDIVETTQTTTSTTYVDLTTLGPGVTITTGTQAIVAMTCFLDGTVAGNHAAMGFAVSGASAIAAVDNVAVRSVTGLQRQSIIEFVTGLTAGSNFFLAKYRSSAVGNTASFANRRCFVIPL